MAGALDWAMDIWNFFANIGNFFLSLLGYQITKESIKPPSPTDFLKNSVILILTIIVAFVVGKLIATLVKNVL